MAFNPDILTSGLFGASAFTLVGVFAFFLFLFVLVSYVYTSFAIYTIAKKTRVEPTWLAWVPIVNVVLLLKIAKLQWQWIFALFVMMIPVMGHWLLAAGNVYVWWKVAKALRKPEWLGILMIVPFVNFIVMGYLAWSK